MSILKYKMLSGAGGDKPHPGRSPIVFHLLPHRGFSPLCRLFAIIENFDLLEILKRDFKRVLGVFKLIFQLAR